ncbi:MAG: hypothetical protein AB8G05_17005 [Oligoflexales bacterium]
MGKKVGEEISFISWQIYKETQSCPVEHRNLKADTLRVWNGYTLLSGPNAWLFLLEAHPQLSTLNWLSQKLGISKEVSNVMNWTGKTARRICFKCKK